jgi:hypothetical protein
MLGRGPASYPGARGCAASSQRRPGRCRGAPGDCSLARARPTTVSLKDIRSRDGPFILIRLSVDTRIQLSRFIRSRHTAPLWKPRTTCIHVLSALSAVLQRRDFTHAKVRRASRGGVGGHPSSRSFHSFFLSILL